MIRRLLALLVTLLALDAQAATIRIEQYFAALQRLDALLATNQLELARTEARTLLPYEIESPRGTFHADESLLGAIIDPRSSVPQTRARLALTLRELRLATGVEGSAADRKLLDEIARQQEVEPLEAGGEVAPIKAEGPLIDRILESIEKIVKWIGKQLERLLDWLISLLPEVSGDAGATGGIGTIVIVVTVAILLLVLLLAFIVARRSRNAALESQSSEPIGSTRDEDPLSRGANEWERYAQQLAREGRHREAIRAWFHAVLVTCYSEGILHFRKGRTNWEYIASLSPSLAWRPDLIALTRRFEQEWYGSDQSTEDALDDCSARAQRILDALHDSKGAAA